MKTNKEKKAEYSKAYRATNKEKIAAQRKLYREANKEKVVARKKLYYAANKEKVAVKSKLYHASNKEKIAVRKKLYRADNKEKIAARMKEYQAHNKGHIIAQQKLYYAANKERIIAREKEYQRRQYRDGNLNYLIPKRLRIRLNNAIRGNFKAGSAVKDLGCSISEFKLKFESLFTEGMTWGNWGTVWHLDHIIPLSFFDLTDETELKVAVHYTNLQPLLVTDNLKKSDKLPK